MANQFNTTTHYTQTTSDNTPTSAEFLGQAIFTGDEWQTLINALDNYESQISDLAEVMPADDQTATTAHHVSGKSVGVSDIVKEIDSLKTLKQCAIDDTQSNAINLLFGIDLPIIPHDFGSDEVALSQINLSAIKTLAHAVKYTAADHLEDFTNLQATQQGAKDKATKKAIKYHKNKLNHLASINDKLAKAIYDICLWLCEATGKDSNSIVLLPPVEAINIFTDLWYDYVNVISTQHDSGQDDTNAPAPCLECKNTTNLLQQLESRLMRQRIAHSDSITTSICHLEYIKANLQALESVTFDNNPNFEDSQEYLLFASLNYLIGSYTKDRQSEQNQLGQGGNHASL